MGQNYSNFDKQSIEKFVQKIFQNEKHSRLKRRDYLVVGDVHQLEMPDEYSLNFNHIGLLYCLDVDKDGRFYVEDLVTFAQEIVEQIDQLKADKKAYELESQLMAFCTQKMWKQVYGVHILEQAKRKAMKVESAAVSKRMQCQEQSLDPDTSHRHDLKSEEEKLSSMLDRGDLSSTAKPIEELDEEDIVLQGEEDFIQWISRLLIENQRHVKNQPIQYFQANFNKVDPLQQASSPLGGDGAYLQVHADQLDSSAARSGGGQGRLSRVSGGVLKSSTGGGAPIPFISSLTVKHLYEIINVRQSHNIEFQGFFALLQQASEEMNIMDVTDKRQDDYLPLQVVQEFCRSFVRGFGNLMKDVGFADRWTECELNKERALFVHGITNK